MKWRGAGGRLEKWAGGEVRKGDNERYSSGVLIVTLRLFRSMTQTQEEKKPALLVIDVQTAFLMTRSAVKSLERATWYINAAIALFREKNLPVDLHASISNPNEGFTQRVSEGFQVHKDIDIVLTSPHHQDLWQRLQQDRPGQPAADLGVDTLVITGYMAEGCVLSTYRGALDVDLTPIILRGSIVSHTPEHEKFVETIGNLVTIGALRKFLE